MNKQKIISRSKKLDNVRYEVRGAVAEEAESMTARGEKIIKLNIGNPCPFGFNAPESIKASLDASYIRSQGYSVSRGIYEARQAAADYFLRKGIEGVTADDVYTGNGVSELILLTMRALLNDGDEMLVPSPDYPLWTAAVNLTGGKAVHYICDESSDWFPDIDDIKKRITSRTRGIILINPNNPTGAVYPKQVLSQITDVCRENGLIIFSDEIYDRLLMDGEKHVSIASLCPDIFTVTMNGLSKSHMIPGFRCGFMAVSGDKSGAGEYIKALNTLASMRLCSNVLAQSLIADTLGSASPDPLYLPGGRMYEQREFMYSALNSVPGIKAIKPRAAFYIFPKIDLGLYKRISDDELLALSLLRNEHVLIVHGTGFNINSPDHFRITYLPEIPVLEESVIRIKRELDRWK
ncbi:MAG: pyridoxal phosphate-dependent aminotransferase [Oscillospiraceae bacterium]|nr:pyridoxal phosphate-dependent aminotransferase [Oscillospiraceae bacterium]